MKATSSPSPLLAAGRLGWREIIRFLRQRNRLIGAIGTPLLFWALFGAGLDRSFRVTESGGVGQSFSEYYLPGSVMLIVLFTAIFTTISVIEDRREGFLQSVLVAPLARWQMVLGKVWGGSVIAVGQGLLFLLLAWCFHGSVPWWAMLQLVPLLFLAAIALTSLGLIFAWNMESTQGFHAIMNLVLMPMWLLSGAFFPAPAVQTTAPLAQHFVHWAVRCNPLSYAVAGARRIMYGELLWDGVWLPSLETAWVVTTLFAVATFAGACVASSRRHSGDWI